MGDGVGNLKCGKQPKISTKHKNKLNDVNDNDDDDKINGKIESVGNIVGDERYTS